MHDLDPLTLRYGPSSKMARHLCIITRKVQTSNPVYCQDHGYADGALGFSLLLRPAPTRRAMQRFVLRPIRLGGSERLCGQGKPRRYANKFSPRAGRGQVVDGSSLSVRCRRHTKRPCFRPTCECVVSALVEKACGLMTVEIFFPQDEQCLPALADSCQCDAL